MWQIARSASMETTVSTNVRTVNVAVTVPMELVSCVASSCRPTGPLNMVSLVFSVFMSCCLSSLTIPLQDQNCIYIVLYCIVLYRRVYLNLFQIDSKRRMGDESFEACCQWALLNVHIITLLFPFTVQKYIYPPVSKVHAGSVHICNLPQGQNCTCSNATYAKATFLLAGINVPFTTNGKLNLNYV